MVLNLIFLFCDISCYTKRFFFSSVFSVFSVCEHAICDKILKRDHSFKPNSQYKV